MIASFRLAAGAATLMAALVSVLFLGPVNQVLFDTPARPVTGSLPDNAMEGIAPGAAVTLGFAARGLHLLTPRHG